MSAKAESLFLQRKNPRKISWTVVYRRMHRKGVTEEVAKKRSKKTQKVGWLDLTLESRDVFEIVVKFPALCGTFRRGGPILTC